MTSKKQSARPRRRKVQRHLWLPPEIGAALVRAAADGQRDVTRQATIYITEGLRKDGGLVAETQR